MCWSSRVQEKFKIPNPKQIRNPKIRNPKPGASGKHRESHGVLKASERGYRTSGCPTRLGFGTNAPPLPRVHRLGFPDFEFVWNCRGRDTGCPAPPSQIPACGFLAPGSSPHLALAYATRSGKTPEFSMSSRLWPAGRCVSIVPSSLRC